MNDVLERLARIEARIETIVEQNAELRPLLRSAAVSDERLSRFSADLDALGARYRALAPRVSALEKRGARDAGIAVGAFAALQLLWSLGEKVLEAMR